MTPADRSLVLVHGFAQTPASWKPTIEALPRGFKVAAPELPGHGATALKIGDPSPKLARRVVTAAIDRVGGPAVLWGYSQGARVALDVALERPNAVLALVLESGLAGIDDPVARADRRSRDDALSRRIERASIDQFVSLWERTPALGDPSEKIVQAQRPDRLRHDPVALAAALRGLGQAAYEPMWERLGEIKVPVLLITGELDETYVRHAERLLQLLPQGEHRSVAETGHSVHIAAPEISAGLVADFIARFS